MDNSDTKVIQEVSWLGPLMIVIVHAGGLGLLYLLLAVLGPAFVEHYQQHTIEPTPLFESVHRYSDLFIRFPKWILAAIVFDALIVRSIAIRASRWLSFYSHSCLVALGLLMFVSITWMIHPMATANRIAAGLTQAIPVSAPIR